MTKENTKPKIRNYGGSEMSAFINQKPATNFRINIIQFPSGRWGFVGSIPLVLTKENKTSLVPGARSSKSYDSKEDALADAAKEGYYEGKLYSKETGKEISEIPKERITQRPPKISRGRARITPKRPRIGR
jgi:hypothetical protein